MFQNPISRPSHKKCRKTIITQKVLLTQSSNIVHCNWHTQKPKCEDLQAFANIFPHANWCFFQFFVRAVQETAKISYLLILTGKMHQNGLSGVYLGFEACQIQCLRFRVSCNKQFLKNHNFRQKFHILLILTGKNASKLLEWHIFRVWGMPNSMALVASLYDKGFMKNHNFWRHIAENGVQNHENGMGNMLKSSLGPILPLHHVSEPNIFTFP